MKAPVNGHAVGMTLHLLHRAGQCADEIFADLVGDSTMTPRQFAVLKAIGEAKEPSQTMLVESTGIDRSTIADIVRRLLDRGMVTRERARRDARAYEVRLTAKGQSAIRLAEPAARKTDDRLLASLSPAERGILIKALTRILERHPD